MLVETYLSAPASGINCEGSIIDINHRADKVQASYTG